MTLPFDKIDLPPPAPGIFVLIHPNLNGQRLSLSDGDAAGVLANCRAALDHARRINMAIAFIAAWPRNFRIEICWIKGLEPTGRDMVFRRAYPSCYASRYFAEAMEDYGTLVMAGFLNAAERAATVVDALRAGHDTIFLRDAIAGARHESDSIGGWKALAGGRIWARDTAAWKAATDFGSAQANAGRLARAILPSTRRGHS